MLYGKNIQKTLEFEFATLHVSAFMYQLFVFQT